MTLKTTEIPLLKKCEFYETLIIFQLKTKLIGQNLDTWLYLAARKLGNVGFFSR